MQNEYFGKVDKPIEDRVTHIESTLPNLARLQEQMDLFDKVDVLSMRLHALLSNHQEMQSKVVDLLNKHNESVRNMSEDGKDLHKSNDELVSKSSMMQEKLDRLDESFKKVSQDVSAHRSSLENKISDVQDSFAVHPGFAKHDELLINIMAQQELMKKDIAVVKLQIDQAKLFQNDFKTDLDSLRHSMEVASKDVEGVLGRMDSIRLENRKYQNETSDNFSKQVQMLKDELYAKFEQLPKPENISLDSFKDDLMKKIEPASFDAKNANLRSSNNESKITIAEKKIEQLYLLISKYELNK